MRMIKCNPGEFLGKEISRNDRSDSGYALKRLPETVYRFRGGVETTTPESSCLGANTGTTIVSSRFARPINGMSIPNSANALRADETCPFPPSTTNKSGQCHSSCRNRRCKTSFIMAKSLGFMGLLCLPRLMDPCNDVFFSQSRLILNLRYWDLSISPLVKTTIDAVA